MTTSLNININAITAKIKTVADSVHNELIYPSNYNFAIFGGAVRDLIIADQFNLPIPKCQDVDIIISHKIKDIENRSSIKTCLYNSFGGRKIQMNNGMKIDVFSETRKKLNKFAYEHVLNCYRISYLFFESQIVITPEFYEFLETKTISIIGKPVFKQGPGGLAMQAVITANKLSERFKINFKVDENIVSEIQNMSKKQILELTDYANRKIDKGNMFSDILQDIQKIRNG